MIGDEANRLAHSHAAPRILITGPSLQDFGGVANYLNLLLPSLERMGIISRYVPIGRSSSHSPSWKRPLDYVVSLVRFLVALVSFRPSVIHFNPSLTRTSLPLNILLLLLAKLLTRTPALIFFRGWDEKVAASLGGDKLVWRMCRKILLLADFYLVLSLSFRKTLLQIGFPDDRVQVSSVMVDTLAYQGQKELSTRSPDYPGNVLFLSRIEQDKGIREIVEAIFWLRQFHPDVPIRFIIAGSGGVEDETRLALKQEIQRGTVEMPGYLRGTDKVQAYQTSDIFVFPSYHEGFPNAVLEAMSAGLPLIYTPVGALREILGPGNGVCIPLESLDGPTLGEAIWNLYLDADQRSRMSVVNRKQAMENYDISVVSQQIADTYQAIILSKARK